MSDGVVEERCPNCNAPLSVDAYGKCAYCATVLRHEGATAGIGQVAPTPEIIALIRDGRKINAIKEYRRLTRLGLVEARRVIDDEEARLKAN